MYPFRSILRAGGRLAFGSDWNVSTPDPLLQLEVAGTRCRPGRDGDDALLPNERLTFDHASLLPILLPLRAWHRQAAAGEVQAGEAEITVPAMPINAVLSALVSLEALALRVVNMPIGSSLMCLARKPR